MGDWFFRESLSQVIAFCPRYDAMRAASALCIDWQLRAGNWPEGPNSFELAGPPRFLRPERFCGRRSGLRRRDRLVRHGAAARTRALESAKVLSAKIRALSTNRRG